ncbi:short-chain dehydrogenase [Mycolicibacterium chitae]|uniref:Short chain dehydrogenase n=1 Tax=Mycolicibacterium chitae TaxID=1792 RepID=A0A448I6R3_MYCCI|nr:SDR family oxidoreductase [Mycolicibacterium chitae]MCV7105329.1 SDR family oxidoreductase [Mycolicibacterium chitae]BBZ04345.1 short-chain dehydrogenase [Mycolicibacterium chitae]VEG47982.1 short chain dehydrogenase [Mycolicibacterium chitae]
MAMEVLVTGGDTELGRAVAEEFRDAGHNVVISGARRDELEIAAKELEVNCIVCDPTDPAALAEARPSFPRHLDTIVNVPAPRHEAGDPRTFTPAQHATAWHRELDATVLAPVLTLQTIGDHLRSGGSIISVVPETPREGSAAAAVKAALADWTAGQATQWGTRGITVNVVATGRGTEPGYEGLTTVSPSVAGEIARLSLFLTSPSARQVTGQTLHVSSGVPAHFG